MQIPEKATHKSPISDNVFYYIEGNKVMRWSKSYPEWDFCGFLTDTGFVSKLIEL